MQSAATPLSERDINDLHPADVGWLWALGNNDELNFGPDSEFSQIFADGAMAERFEWYTANKFVTERAKWDADIANGYSAVEDYGHSYKWYPDAVDSGLNPADQLLGSVTGSASIEGSEIVFRLKNTISLRSLAFGRQLTDAGLPSLPELPNMDKTIHVEWRRDLSGLANRYNSGNWPMPNSLERVPDLAYNPQLGGK